MLNLDRVEQVGTYDVKVSVELVRMTEDNQSLLVTEVYVLTECTLAYCMGLLQTDRFKTLLLQQKIGYAKFRVRVTTNSVLGFAASFIYFELLSRRNKAMAFEYAAMAFEYALHNRLYL